MRPIMSRGPAALALVVVLLVLAACAGAGSALPGGDAAAPAASEAAGLAGDQSAERDAGRTGEATGGGPAGEEGNAAPIEQRIIKTGEVSVEVPNVAAAVGQVRAFVLELGGYVGGSQAGSGAEGATLTLRIPAARFDDALERLRALDGEVTAEATRETDVTRQVIDLGARIANLEASEASYRVLLDRAERIDDVLAVQARLDEVRGQIEQLTAQLQEIEGDADLSTLTVSLYPVAQPVSDVTATWDPGSELSGAFATLVGIGQGLLNALIWFAVVWLPVLLVLALLVLLALRAVLEVRRRLPIAPAGREVPPG